MKIHSINSQYSNKNLNYNKMKQSNITPSFKGGIKDGLATMYGAVSKTNIYQNLIQRFSKSDKTFTHLLVAESCFLSGFYMINTLRNKKIDKEQKPQMLINDTLTLGVSTAGAYLVEDKITDVVMRGAEKYFTKHGDFYKKLGKEVQQDITSPKNELLKKVVDTVSKTGNELTQGIDDVADFMGKQLKNVVGEKGKKLKAFQVTSEQFDSLKTSVKTALKDNAGKVDDAKNVVTNLVDDIYTSSAAREQADKTLSGINKLKVLVIFGLIYRYLGPVVITPIANKLSSKFFENKKEKTPSVPNDSKK